MAEPQSNKNGSAKREHRAPIRLACVCCDRDDFDGVWRRPKDWTSIHKHQTLKQSLAPINESENSDWFTHLGLCPDCKDFDT